MNTHPTAPVAPAVPSTVSLRDDLSRHGDNISRNLATVTIVMIAVTAFLDRNTNYNSSSDYLLMIVVQFVLFLVIEGVGHLRHHKRLRARRAVR